MFLPRRRITSLTIASLIVFMVWYLKPFKSDQQLLEEGVFKHALSDDAGSPSKPKDHKAQAILEPPEAAEGIPSPSEDRFADILFDTRPVPSSPAEDSTIEEKEPSRTAPLDDLLATTERPSVSEAAIRPTTTGKAGSTDTGQRKFLAAGQGNSRAPGLNFKEKHPVTKLRTLPTGSPKNIPKIQHSFDVKETHEARKIRRERLDAVKESFAHSWAGYKAYAWGKDELAPVDGGSKQRFGGWAATLVDTLDTLWIVGMKQEFKEAVAAVADLKFTESTEDHVNVFETTIRYLGGFLAAYDLTQEAGEDYPILLTKAIEVADLVYCAFDTPNRMPVTRWPWKQALSGEDQHAKPDSIVAEVGSLTLEFTRLSQLTGDMKYYDAISRIMDKFENCQERTDIPGLWPTIININEEVFQGNGFTLGGMADSLYEYLPKQHMLLGGHSTMYEKMYKSSIKSAMTHIFFQPMLPDNADVLFCGNAGYGNGGFSGEPAAQHLGCYAGGMVGIGAQIFNLTGHINMARKLVDGCVWAYENSRNGIMPEVITLIPCETDSECSWDEEKWEREVIKYGGFSVVPSGDETQDPETPKEKAERIVETNRLSRGIVNVLDRRYILRPEAIESVFIHYRISGDTTLQDKAWKMFEAVENVTRTSIANSAVDDVTLDEPDKSNSMESFWMAETLKYFYLIFAEPDLVSLDEYVLNTEAHPLRRPAPPAKHV